MNLWPSPQKRHQTIEMGRKLKSKLQSSPGMTAEVEVQSDWRNQRRNIVAVIAPAALFQLLFLPFHTHTHSLLVPRDGHFLWGRGLGGGRGWQSEASKGFSCPGRTQNPDVEEKTSPEGLCEVPKIEREKLKLDRFKESGQTHRPIRQYIRRKDTERNCLQPCYSSSTCHKAFAPDGHAPICLFERCPTRKAGLGISSPFTDEITEA